jgi:hypothetical protein
MPYGNCFWILTHHSVCGFAAATPPGQEGLSLWWREVLLSMSVSASLQLNRIPLNNLLTEVIRTAVGCVRRHEEET